MHKIHLNVCVFYFIFWLLCCLLPKYRPFSSSLSIYLRTSRAIFSFSALSLNSSFRFEITAVLFREIRVSSACVCFCIYRCCRSQEMKSKKTENIATTILWPVSIHNKFDLFDWLSLVFRLFSLPLSLSASFHLSSWFRSYLEPKHTLHTEQIRIEDKKLFETKANTLLHRFALPTLVLNQN